MNRRLTASSAALAMRCLYSWRDGVPVAKDEPNEAMQRGTEVHAAIAEDVALYWRKATREYALGEVQPWSEQILRAEAVVELLADERGSLPIGLVEPAYAYTPGGAVRHLGDDIGRKYDERGALPGDICGSADLVLLMGGEAVVCDWKTSNVADDFNSRYDDQLRVLAFMVARAHGVSRVRVAAVNVDHDVKPRWLELDEFDFAEIGAWLDGLESSVAQATPQPGEWCHRCPARSTCPATTAAMVAAPSWALDTPEDVAQVWDRLGPIEDAIAAIRRKAREYVEANGPLTLPSGKRLAIVESKGRESIAVKDVPADVAAEFRAKGIIKCGAPTKSLREVK